MSAIISIATTTFRESIRNRTVLAIFLLSLGVVLSGLLLAALALDQRVRVIKDWGLFCVSSFGVLLAILMGVSLVHKEIRTKSLYVVLTRPIGRWQYVLGKFLGLAFTLLLEVGALSAALLILLAIEGTAPDDLLLKSLALSLFEIWLVASLAIFFASFSSPYLSGFFTLGLFAVGRSLPTLLNLVDKIQADFSRIIAKGLVFILPDLSGFNMSTRAVHGIPIAGEELGWLLAYATGYTACLLFGSAWIFSRRNLT